MFGIGASFLIKLFFYPKLVTKSDIRGRGYIEIVTSPSKKIM